MARKTVEELEKEQLAALTKATDEAHAVKQATLQKNIDTYNQGVDASVEKQKGVYEGQIRDAERVEKAQYDDNYIDELVARKNLENSMADMGLTDSGLNRGQQTAISVMRGNADARARQTAVNSVSALKDAIDQAIITGDQKKTTYQQEQSAALSEWYQNQMLANKQSARSTAVEQYKAETEAIEKQEEATRGLTSDIATYVMKRMKDDPKITIDVATLEGKLLYNVADEKDKITYDGMRSGYTGAALNAYVQAGGGDSGEKAAGEQIAASAHALVSNMSFEVSGKIWDFRKGTFWRSAGEGDGRLVGEKVKEKLESNEAFQKMSALEQKAAASFAIARSVEQSFPNASYVDNKNRIRRACEEYSIADYDFAISYYTQNDTEQSISVSTSSSAPNTTVSQAEKHKKDMEVVDDYYKNAGSMPGRLL